MATLPTLPENNGLAFTGEPAWPPAVVTSGKADGLRTTVNPSGRPNSDVLRGFLGLEANRFRERWQVDFAPHLTTQEAALYEEPFALLTKKCGDAKPGTWWVNPVANLALRGALAKLDRFLVTAVAGSRPAWTWVEAGWLPDDSLLAVARDDDFALGLLQSRAFTIWWDAGRSDTEPQPLVESFPFPWPARTLFGSLTGPQQRWRSEVTRAVINLQTVELDAAVAGAYGWPPALDDAELLLRLRRLHRSRAAGP